MDRALSLLDALGIPPEPADFGGEKIFREPIEAPEPPCTTSLHHYETRPCKERRGDGTEQ